MQATDIFAGPIVRRAQEDMICIWLATRKPFRLGAFVRPRGDREWLGLPMAELSIDVQPQLYVQLLITAPPWENFPTNTLLEYSIAVYDDEDNPHHEFFADIVQEDGLSYPGLPLPTLYIQGPSQKLCVLYASCRKIHDSKGGANDALAFGDLLISQNKVNLSTRPAVLCLTGDQIYADDVHDEAFDEVTRVARELTGGTTERLPGNRPLPGKGSRQEFVRDHARFTSGAAANHLITLAEYAAMYGLAWCPHNWSKRSYSKEVQGFVDSLPKARRLMANTPTYMIFDDHDVTDDWNLSVRWKEDVWAFLPGRRIVANALFNYWLFQAWGNDPYGHARWFSEVTGLLAKRQDQSPSAQNTFDDFFWSRHDWEFATPTRPFIYFLDTRTERGHRDGRRATDGNAPAYLKRIESWAVTTREIINLLSRQNRINHPLVLVSPAPVFGFATIDALQGVAGKLLGPTPLDLESWSANLRHLLLFLGLCADYNVVLLSGDVHYAYTSTVKFSNFDDDFHRAVVKIYPGLWFPKKGTGPSPTYQFLYASRYIQLTSSAAKNYASNVLQSAASFATEYSYFVNNVGEVKQGTFKNGELRILKGGGPHDPPKLEVVKLEDYKPGFALYQRYNDAYNSAYVGEHNIGFLTIHQKKVENSFLTMNGRIGARTWDFGSEVYWEGKARGF